MLARIAFILITLFWVIMNVLLWRAEYGQPYSVGASLDAEVVWQIMLAAPDSSLLTVYHHGKKIGFCHWTPSVGEGFSKLPEDGARPEGMVERVIGYRIQLEGSLALGASADRLRFESSLKLTTNHDWQEFAARLDFKPSADSSRGVSGQPVGSAPALLEVRSLAADQTLRLKTQNGDTSLDRVIRFSEFQHPGTLLREFAGPLADSLLPDLALTGGQQSALPLPSDLKWEAWNDSIKIGHSRVRAYRLQARFPGSQARLFVSGVGEILRVELPDDLLLLNDQFNF